MDHNFAIELLHEQNLLVAEIFAYRLGPDSKEAKRLMEIDEILRRHFHERQRLRLEPASRQSR